MNAERDLDRDDADVLSEAQAVLLAALAWTGAALAWPVPLAPAAVIGLGGLVTGRRVVVMAAAFALAAGAGHRADAAFRPIGEGPFTGEVSLVTDPRPVGPIGWRAIVRLADRRRVEMIAYGEPGFELADHGVGDRLQVEGRLRGADDRPWTRSRHLVGRLPATEVVALGGPTGPRRLVEAVRDVIVAGADGLPERDRPLYLGLVIGDDRFQTPSQRARFEAAGLTHLLAVSGQNVAFVLAVVQPVLARLGRRRRLVVTVGVLVGFAAATRFEPSVLRATATAGLAAAATSEGHRQSGVRLLALAVSALVVIDPFLVDMVGFQLSVAASAGILILGPVISSRVPLPRFVAEPLAVTLAAQLAVAPLLLRTFGPVSVASVPANLLAGWAAGLVMTWGLTVGPVAGLAPEPVAGVMQAPARWLVVWLDGVAAWASRLPLPLLDGPGLLFGLTCLVALWSLAGLRGRWWRAVRWAGAGALVVGVVAAVPGPPSQPTDLAGGARWYPGGDRHLSVLVVGEGGDDVLTALLVARISAIDVVVSTAGRGRGAETAGEISELVPVGLLLAPGHHGIVGATRVTTVVRLDSRGGELTVEPLDDRLVVSAR